MEKGNIYLVTMKSYNEVGLSSDAFQELDHTVGWVPRMKDLIGKTFKATALVYSEGIYYRSIDLTENWNLCAKWFSKIEKIS